MLNSIVQEYYERGDIRRIISGIKMSPNSTTNKELLQDLEHDIIEILLKHKDPNKLIELHQQDKLKYYIYGMSQRMVFGRNSRYNKDVIEYERRRSEIVYYRDNV